uniref:Uncharacterized protein n=1 Tax=Rhizophora mucronata TaxID=61149 RepID=A0A2P2NIK2_RHIMU
MATNLEPPLGFKLLNQKEIGRKSCNQVNKMGVQGSKYWNVDEANKLD